MSCFGNGCKTPATCNTSGCHRANMIAEAKRMRDAPLADPAAVASLDGPVVKFWYVNWHGAVHDYTIAVESIEFGIPGGATGPDQGPEWLMHGQVITRDGDTRPSMGPTRRRSFAMAGIRAPEVM